MSDSDGDDVPRLSAHTLAALQEFYNETSVATSKDKLDGGTVEEDWVRCTHMLKSAFCSGFKKKIKAWHHNYFPKRMSQFWYNDETAARLAEEVIREAGVGGR